jgi:hypothetical protein
LSECNTTCDISINTDLLTIDTNAIDDWISTDDFSITLTEPVEFGDRMPDITKVHNMCGYYPALQKAYENFKSIYQMVEQDYIGNYQEDDELPF